jgi:hypothetical protein
MAAFRLFSWVVLPSDIRSSASRLALHVQEHLELPHRGIAIARGIAISRGLQWLGHNNNRLVGHDRNNKNEKRKIDAKPKVNN